MTDILTPDALLKLWAERDDRVLLAYKDGDEPGAIRPVISDTVAESPVAEETDEPEQESLISETRPVRTVTPYPTYKIAPKPLNPATYHARKPKR